MKHGIKNKGMTLTPQFFVDDQCCGTFEDFELAIECDRLEDFLSQKSSTSSSSHTGGNGGDGDDPR